LLRGQATTHTYLVTCITPKNKSGRALTA
jgi:hypothetical protein